eukprot:CAMPEP_0197862906 /NCGR_PEP_ID=MMETSP1438-20131217/40007_1 /TAXON_ID=1461541 /ORGANISM="Pterosperma sp., Strain CCMP1384" /LENGTH=65 /DNA_ID=CAMNT_0043480623 /DNA_START=72 /DNA_END=266 /DNA_ORIENTATION=+
MIPMLNGAWMHRPFASSAMQLAQSEDMRRSAFFRASVPTKKGMGSLIQAVSTSLIRTSYPSSCIA